MQHQPTMKSLAHYLHLAFTQNLVGQSGSQVWKICFHGRQIKCRKQMDVDLFLVKKGAQVRQA